MSKRIGNYSAVEHRKDKGGGMRAVWWFLRDVYNVSYQKTMLEKKKKPVKEYLNFLFEHF